MFGLVNKSKQLQTSIQYENTSNSNLFNSKINNSWRCGELKQFKNYYDKLILD